jgi:hypothetical protein
LRRDKAAHGCDGHSHELWGGRLVRGRPPGRPPARAQWLRCNRQAGPGGPAQTRGSAPLNFRRIPTLLPVVLLALASTVGCRQDMQNQPKYIPLRPSGFFADGRSERPLTEGTVARGHLDDDVLLYTGKGPDGKPANEFPFPVTKEVIERGQNRFDIYCAPCHDRLGNGDGMIVRRGFRKPPSYHIDRLRSVPHGYIFDVITNGFGAMPDYAAQIQPHDRWAIVAYVRALQLSQNFPANNLSPAQRAQLVSQGGGR